MKIETKYAIVTETAFDRAMQIARGCYQRSLVMGREALEAAIASYRALSPRDLRERVTLFRTPEHRKAYLDGIDLATAGD